MTLVAEVGVEQEEAVELSEKVQTNGLQLVSTQHFGDLSVQTCLIGLLALYCLFLHCFLGDDDEGRRRFGGGGGDAVLHDFCLLYKAQIKLA